jgi:hypothetical protein
MSNPLDVQRNLDHCMQNVRDASQAMVDDMHGAAMRLGAAEMMLTSASYAVHKRAAQPAQARTQRDTGEQPGAEGS